jgi:hypothetical protein
MQVITVALATRLQSTLLVFGAVSDLLPGGLRFLLVDCAIENVICCSCVGSSGSLVQGVEGLFLVLVVVPAVECTSALVMRLGFKPVMSLCAEGRCGGVGALVCVVGGQGY